MKVKMKFDLASIKGWLLAHGEKVALGVVGMVFLLFVYSAMQRETLEEQYAPEKMQQLAATVGEHVRNSKWDPDREKLKVVSYAERAKPKIIPVGTYALPRAFNPPVTDPKAKRGIPEVLPPEELRVAAGMDVIQVKAADRNGARQGDQENAGNALKAQPWAVVTGLVPINKERQAFAQAYAEAVEFDRNRDVVPKYLRPVLERAEVDPAKSDQKPDQLTWSPVPDPGPVATGSRRDDLVPAKYLDASLSAPLETLAIGQWGEAVSHPKIPLVGEEVDRPVPPVQEPDAAGGRDQPRDAGKPDDKQKAAPAEDVADSGVTYLLLRAFDYGVEPGKKYRYRVKLELQNPNSGISPQFLQDPASAAASKLTSEPTEPTPVVTIPDGHDVLAGPIDAGSRYTEPMAKVVITSIDRKSGLKAATEIEARRGSVANTPPREVSVRHPIDKAVVKLNLGFESNFMVLDIYGGDNLSGRRRDPPITKPGEILLLDANGNMTVRSEMDDHMQYEDTLVRDEPPKKDASALEDERDEPRRGRIQNRN